jgi:hypothetical protein
MMKTIICKRKDFYTPTRFYNCHVVTSMSREPIFLRLPEKCKEGCKECEEEMDLIIRGIFAKTTLD